MPLEYALMCVSILAGVGCVVAHRETQQVMYPLREKRHYRFTDHFNLLMLVLNNVAFWSGAVALSVPSNPTWCKGVMGLVLFGVIVAQFHTHFIFGRALKRQYDLRNFPPEQN